MQTKKKTTFVGLLAAALIVGALAGPASADRGRGRGGRDRHFSAPARVFVGGRHDRFRFHHRPRFVSRPIVVVRPSYYDYDYYPYDYYRPVYRSCGPSFSFGVRW